MTMKRGWDTELYEARHAFVWQLAEGVLDLLDPKPGEHILDLGCGTGQLTQKIVDSGATVIGVDASPEMIGQARQNYPKLQFQLQNATTMAFNVKFDAVFSNATLHWVLDATAAVRSIYNALKQGGRFVAEFGGHGNIGQIDNAVRNVLSQYVDEVPPSPWYYPTIGEYASLLEAQCFEVRFAHLFDRPTPLQGDNGMADWLRQFASSYFEVLNRDDRSAAVRRTVEELRPALYRDGQWFADYRRLRVVAVTR